MEPRNYRRPQVINRPWLTSKLYDDLTRKSILHCDAWVYDCVSFKALVIDWREGGRERVALDGWLIEPDGLTPLWDAASLDARFAIRWTAATPWLAPLHARVLVQAREAAASGRWSRVSVLAHYVRADDVPVDVGRNMYSTSTKRA